MSTLFWRFFFLLTLFALGVANLSVTLDAEGPAQWVLLFGVCVCGFWMLGFPLLWPKDEVPPLTDEEKRTIAVEYFRSGFSCRQNVSPNEEEVSGYGDYVRLSADAERTVLDWDRKE